MKSNLLIRTLTGIVFVLLLVGSITTSAYSVATLFAAVTILGAVEFAQLRRNIAGSVTAFSMVLTACLVYLLFTLLMLDVIPGKAISLLLLLVPALVIADLFSGKHEVFSHTVNGLLTTGYIAIPFALLNALVIDTGESYEYWLLLGFFILLWSNDTFAYICGRLFGRHKLWERISPNKTIEGFIGGIAFSLLAAWIISLYVPLLSTLEWLCYALLISLAGTAGDLSESLLKRRAGVKDSGNLLPGHGGVLDRFDGVLLAAPVCAVFIWITQ